MSSKQKFALLIGMVDEKNPLHLLDKNLLIWAKIWSLVKAWYDEHVELTDDAYLPDRPNKWSEWTFPAPTGININMMPCKYFDLENSLPEQLKTYIQLIRLCHVPFFEYEKDDINKYKLNQNKIVYLTIQETLVPLGQCQRRPGLHIESPLAVRQGGTILSRPDPWDYNSLYAAVAWGGGAWISIPDGKMRRDGIYMASNLADTCRVYPAIIRRPESFVTPHGGLEHARDFLGEPRKLEKDRLYWFTDRTPHECLPVTSTSDDPEAKEVWRSFFRLVVGDIGVWYSKHNTPNPLGVQPDCPICADDKFDQM